MVIWGARRGRGDAEKRIWGSWRFADGGRRAIVKIMTPSLHPMLSDEQCSQFSRDGCLLVTGLLDATDLEWLRSIFDVCFDPGYTDREIKRRHVGETVDGKAVPAHIDGPSESFPELGEQPCFSRFVAIAQQLLGEGAEFRGDYMVLTPGGYEAPTPWHQDQAHEDPRYRYREVSIRIPLQDATEENGCMHFVPGSHLGVVLPHVKIDAPGDGLSALGQEHWSANGLPMPCPAGGATVYHSYMLHYAGPNRTDTASRAYVVVFGVPPRKLSHPLVFGWQH